MLEHIPVAPPDAILGLTEAFRNDPRREKINLSIGVYLDDQGQVPLLASVAEAERRIVASHAPKTYLPIPGAAPYAQSVSELLFAPGHEALASGRIAFAHTPGGTGALRVAADLIHNVLPGAAVWLSDPTWPNHAGIFAAAGVPTRTYPYFDPLTNALRLSDLLAAIESMPPGDVILLHGCCHNPTGIDPTDAQWRAIADKIRERELLPLLDFAYQGFAHGLREDAIGLQSLADAGLELLACSSFSKNFSLYRERVGALCAVAATADAATALQSQINRAIRANYSNPPAHGALIVDAILRDAPLRAQWEEEVAVMRRRIDAMRHALVDLLAERDAAPPGDPGRRPNAPTGSAAAAGKGGRPDYSFIKRQRGMFSFSGLSPQQVEALRSEFAIYVVKSGRMNVAGLTSSNVARVAEAIAQVVESNP